MSGSRGFCTETANSFENSCGRLTQATHFLRNRQISPASSSNTGTEFTLTDRMSPSATARKSDDGKDTAAENRTGCLALTSPANNSAEGEEESPLSHRRIYQQHNGHFPPEEVEPLSRSVSFGSCTLPSSNVSDAVSTTCTSRPNKPCRLSLCVPPQRCAEKELQSCVNHLQTLRGTEAAGGKLSLLQQSASRCADHCPPKMTTGKTSVNSPGCASQAWSLSLTRTSRCAEDSALSRSSSLLVKSRPSSVTGCGACSALDSGSGCCSSPGVNSAPPGDAFLCPAASCCVVSVCSTAVSCCCCAGPPHAHLLSASPALGSGKDCSHRSSLSAASLAPCHVACSLPGSTSRSSSAQNWTSDPAPSPVVDPAPAPPSSSSQCPENGSSSRHRCSPLPKSLPEDNPRTPLTSPDTLEPPSRTPSSSSVESVDSGVWSPLPSPSTSTSISLFPVTLATTTTSTTTSTSSQPPPPPPLQAQAAVLRQTSSKRDRCQTDFERLGRSVRALQDACFYYPQLDSDGAQELLQDAAPGTFLVRDSSDSRFLFAVSLKTERGPTSVRIGYKKGLFQMDCANRMKKVLPRFETMLELLDFHTAVCRHSQGAQYRWLETSARRDLLVQLTVPRRHSPPSLSHQARVTINRNMEDVHLPGRSTDLLPLPASMKQFLRDYPYRV